MPTPTGGSKGTKASVDKSADKVSEAADEVSKYLGESGNLLGEKAQNAQKAAAEQLPSTKQVEKVAHQTIDEVSEGVTQARDSIGGKLPDTASARAGLADAGDRLATGGRQARDAVAEQLPSGEEVKGRVQRAADKLTSSVNESKDHGALGRAADRAAGVTDTAVSEGAGAVSDVKDIVKEAQAELGLEDPQGSVKDAATQIAELLKKAFVPTALFEEYLGTATTIISRTALQIKDHGSALNPGDKGDLETMRQARVKVLAQRLGSRLEPYVQGDHAKFEETITAEAKALASIPFGAPLLHVIGYIYQEAANPWLGSAVGTFFTRVAHKAGAGASSLVGKVNLGLMKVDITIGKMDTVAQLKYLEERLGGAITHLWNVLTAEAEGELREITGIVLKTGSAPKEVLTTKAEALHKLGAIFLAAEAPKEYLTAPPPPKDPLTPEDVRNTATNAANKAATYLDDKGMPVAAAVAGAAGEVAQGEAPALFLHGAAAVQGASDAAGEAIEDAGPRLREAIRQGGGQARATVGQAADSAQGQLAGLDPKAAGDAAGRAKQTSPEEALDKTLEQVGKVAPKTAAALDEARPQVARAQQEVAAPLVGALQGKQPQLEALANEAGRQAVLLSEAVQKAFNEPERAEDHLAAAAEKAKDGLIDHKDAAADVMQALAEASRPAADNAADIAKDVGKGRQTAARADKAADAVKSAADTAEALAEKLHEADAGELKQAAHEQIKAGHKMAGEGRQQGAELIDQAQGTVDELAGQTQGAAKAVDQQAQAGLDQAAEGAAGAADELSGQAKKGSKAGAAAGGKANAQAERVAQRGGELADSASAKGQDVADTAAKGLSRTADAAAADAPRVAKTVHQGAKQLGGIADDTTQDLSQIAGERGQELKDKTSKIYADTKDGAKKFQALGEDMADETNQYYQRGDKEILKPGAKNVGDAAPVVGKAVGDKIIKPLAGQVAGDAVPAAKAVAGDVRTLGDTVAENAVPVTEDYTENLLKPTATWAANTIQLQARAVAKEAGPLAEGLPRSLRKAVQLHRVPKDLAPDLLHLAALFDPLVEQVKVAVSKLPVAAEAVAGHIEPVAEKLADAAVATAHDVAEAAPGVADSTADGLVSAAKTVEAQAPAKADAASASLAKGAASAGAQLKEVTGSEATKGSAPVKKA